MLICKIKDIDSSFLKYLTLFFFKVVLKHADRKTIIIIKKPEET